MTSIVVTLEYEAVHRWKQCPLEKVSFLKYPHRHIFHIKAKKLVKHDNRQIEIIMFKRQLNNYLCDTYGLDFGNMSCEMIAKDLLVKFNLSSCEVLEDGENGAEVTI